ncbi:hypothetical protein G3I60_04915 [Streptomyces sp. SID13666]|nr:hypothetical protein [Streptomyces sp. SID13666]
MNYRKRIWLRARSGGGDRSVRAKSFAFQVLANVARTSAPFVEKSASEASGSPGFLPELRRALASNLAGDRGSRGGAGGDHPGLAGESKPPEVGGRARGHDRCPSGTAPVPPFRPTIVPPVGPRPHVTGNSLLELAAIGLEEARSLRSPSEQYATAHLAALRAAAAVLAIRGRPETVGARRRPRIRSAWEVLPEIAPELAEFSRYFGAGARTRARAEAGIADATNAHGAEQMIRNSEDFLEQVRQLLEASKSGFPVVAESTDSESESSALAALPRWLVDEARLA